MTGGDYIGNVVNDGEIVNPGTIDGELTNDGTITIESPHKTVIGDGGELINNGDVNIEGPGGELGNNGHIENNDTINNGGTISSDDPDKPGTINNNDTINNEGGSLDNQHIDNNDGIIDNGSTGGTIGDGTIVDGGIVTLPVINNGVINGSTFDPADGEPELGSTGMVRYRVSFIMLDHGTQVPHQNVERNGKVVLPTKPMEAGWVFGGWYTDKAMTIPWNFPADTVDGNMMLFAAWAECDHSGSTAKPTCTQGATCSLCGAKLAATGHNYQVSANVAATCTEDGYITYTCTHCGDSYNAADGTATGHLWGLWVANADGKTETRTCTVCGATETRNTDGTPIGPVGSGSTVVPDNADNDDEKEGGTDSESGREADLPVDGGELGPVPTSETTDYRYGDGSIIIIIAEADGQQTMVTVEDSEAFVRAVLPADILARAEVGETVEIELSVIHIYTDVPEGDKKLLEEALKEYAQAIEDLEIGMYLDISLRYRVGDGEWMPVTEPTEEIELAIDIPGELLAEEATYFLLRAHDGIVTLLYDLDREAATITIKTNLLSTYALAYTLSEVTDEAIKAADKINRRHQGACGVCGFCPHPLGICIFIWLLIVATAVIIIIVISRKTRKKVGIEDEGGQPLLKP